MRVPVIFMWEYPLGDIFALTVIEYPIVQFIQIRGGTAIYGLYWYVPL